MTDLKEIKVYYTKCDKNYEQQREEGVIEKIYHIDSNGLKQGDYREYYYNGSPRLRTTMVNDKAHGKFIEMERKSYSLS